MLEPIVNRDPGDEHSDEFDRLIETITNTHPGSSPITVASVKKINDDMIKIGRKPASVRKRDQ